MSGEKIDFLRQAISFHLLDTNENWVLDGTGSQMVEAEWW